MISPCSKFDTNKKYVHIENIPTPKIENSAKSSVESPFSKQLKNFLTFTKSVDTDQMQHYAAFHLGLHCLFKYLFRSFPIQKVNT